MNPFILFVIAFGGVFAVTWLVHYIPLHIAILGKNFSPRLFFCKTLGPFDAGLTLILVGGAWAGLGTAIMGINMMVYNVLTGIGLSLGVVFVKKVLKPRWEKQYKKILEDKQEVTITGRRTILER